MDIERISAPSPEIFERDYLRPGRPVVLTGLMDHWGQWTLPTLAERYGSLVLSGNNSLKGSAARPQEVAVGPYLQALMEGRDPGVYLDAMPLSWLPGMADMIVIPPYCPRDRECEILTWVGPGGTCLDFHKDNHTPLDGNQNLLAQVLGRKKVVLVSPQEDDKMYPAPQGEGDYLRSRVRLDAPDGESFPLFEAATQHHTIVEPGQVLFIPAHWWHYVRALETSVTVTFWWRASRLIETLRNFKAAAARGLLPRFLNSHQACLTLRDVEELGGMEAFRQIWEPMAPRVRTLCLQLLDGELARLVQI